jgi:hypothetical protein
MKWTRKIPTTNGYYWWKQNESSEPYIVYVRYADSLEEASCCGSIRIVNDAGFSYGRITKGIEINAITNYWSKINTNKL